MTTRRIVARLLALFAVLALVAAFPGCGTPRQSSIDSVPRLQPSLPTDTTDGFASLAPSGQATVTTTGSAGFRFPIWTPDGRGRIQPALSLQYDGRRGDGLLGLGWILTGLGAIERCARINALPGGPQPVAYEDDEYTPQFCLNGRFLVPADPGSSRSPGTHPFTTEQDDGSRTYIEDADNTGPYYFERWTRDGLIEVYGDYNSPDGILEGRRLMVSPDRSQPAEHYLERDVGAARLRWALTSVRDRDGNTMRIEYGHAPGDAVEQWPTRIVYTGSTNDGAPKPLREVRFSYQDRPDRRVAYVSGLKVQRSRLLTDIQVYGPDPRDQALLREYRLGYRQSGMTGRSLLDSIQECDGHGVCAMPARFGHSAGETTFRRLRTQVTDVAPDPGGAGVTTIINSADFNGDGRDDLLYRAGPSGEWWLRLSAGTILQDPVPAGLPPDPPCGRQHAQAMAIGDVDNDGAADVVYPRFSRRADGFGQTAFDLYHFTGTGLTLGSEVLRDQGPDAVPQLIDMNGDKLPDLVVQYARLILETHPYELTVRMSHGGAWDPPRTLVFPQAQPENPSSLTGSRPRFHEANVVDLDGSGRQALFVPAVRSDYYSGLAYARGNGVARSTPSIRVPYDTDYMVLDVNGDGLPDATDLVIPQPTGSPHHFINTGNGFKAEPWDVSATLFNISDSGPTDSCVRTAPVREKQVFDYDGDGRQDIVLFNNPLDFPGPVWGCCNDNLKVLRSTGSGFTLVDLGIRAGQASAYGRTLSGLFDINGDGLRDLYQVEEGRLYVYLREGQPPDLLTSVNTHAGGHAEWTYRPMSDPAVYHRAASCAHPQACVVGGSWLVAEFAEDNGETVQAAFHRRFQYAGARVDLNGRRWVGMEQIVTEDPATGARTTTTYDNTTVDGPTSVYRRLGLPVRTLKEVPLDGGRHYLLDRQFSYEFTESHNGDYYSLAAQDVVASEYDRPAGAGTGGLVGRTTHRTRFDLFGNVEEDSDRWQWGGDGVTPSRSETRRSTTTYTLDLANWLISQPRQTVSESVAPDGTTGRRTISYRHDQAGHLVQVATEPELTDPSVHTTSSFGYDQFGRLTDSTKGEGPHARRTRYGYDPALDDALPTTVTDPADHSWFLTYHSGFSVPLTQQDPNGDVVAASYDGYGRLRAQRATGGPATQTHYTRAAGRGRSLQVTTSVLGGPAQREIFDTRGRTASVITFLDTPEEVTRDTRYDAAGQVADMTTTAGVAGRTATTGYEYDNLGRLSLMTLPEGGKVTITRTGATASLTASNGGQSQLTIDGLGRPVSLSELAGGATQRHVVTGYEYGLFDELHAASVTPATGPRVRFGFGYDALGHRTAITENGRSVERLAYDPFGDIVRQDQAGEITTTDRDALGRPTKVVRAGRASTYTWDTAAHGIGRLGRASSPDGIVTEFGYQPGGRQSRVAWTVDGAKYALETSYDTFGRVAGLSCLAGDRSSRQSYALSYGDSGQLRQVSDPRPAGTAYWAGQDWLFDSPQRITLGKGVTIEQPLAPTGRVESVRVRSGATLVDGQDYAYDGTGRIDHVTDAVTGLATSYRYDPLGRLRIEERSLKGKPAGSETTTYDDLGRPKRAVDDGPSAGGTRTTTWNYRAPGAPFAPSHLVLTRPGQGAAVGVAIHYDKQGRQTRAAVTGAASATRRSITWRGGLPTSIRLDGVWPPAAAGPPSAGRATVAFRYDAFGQPVTKSIRPAGAGAARSVVSVGGMLDVRSERGVTVRRCGLPLPGRTRVELTSSGPKRSVSFNVGNLRGDVTGVFDLAGGRRIEQRYSSFGARRVVGPAPGAGDDPSPRGFLGMPEDPASGTVTLGARVYDPLIRQFLSRDSVLDMAAGSQAINPYTYARNDPINLADPSGLQSEPDPINPGDTWTTTVVNDIGEQVTIEFGPGYVERVIDAAADTTTGVLTEATMGTDLSQRGGYVGWAGDTTGPQVAGRGKSPPSDPALQLARGMWDPAVGPRPTTWLDKLAIGALAVPAAIGAVGAAAIAGVGTAIGAAGAVLTNAARALAIRLYLLAPPAVELGRRIGEGMTGTPSSYQRTPQLTYSEGFELGAENARLGEELVLGKFPGNVEYVNRTVGTVTLNVPTGWTPMYNAGYVRGFLEEGGPIRFTSQDYTGVFGLEAQQVLGVPGGW